MTTLHALCQACLQLAGQCPITDLFDPRVSGASRSSEYAPVNVANDVVQNLVTELAWGCVPLSYQSYDVTEQCIPPLANDLIDAL